MLCFLNCDIEKKNTSASTVFHCSLGITSFVQSTHGLELQNAIEEYPRKQDNGHNIGCQKPMSIQQAKVVVASRTREMVAEYNEDTYLLGVSCSKPNVRY